MKTLRASRLLSPWILLATTVLVVASVVSVGAQVRPRPNRPSPSQRPPRRPSEPSIQERSFILHELEKQTRTAAKHESLELALAQVGEDYQRIQIVNNRMMAAVMSAPVPDYKLITDATGKIRKLAERLRTNLALPKPDNAEAHRTIYVLAADDAQLKAGLLLLDQSLMSFIKSSLFKNTDVVDAEVAAKASRDLENAIELSRRVGRDAERLGKDSKIQ